MERDWRWFNDLIHVFTFSKCSFKGLIGVGSRRLLFVLELFCKQAIYIYIYNFRNHSTIIALNNVLFYKKTIHWLEVSKEFNIGTIKYKTQLYFYINILYMYNSYLPFNYIYRILVIKCILTLSDFALHIHQFVFVVFKVNIAK